MNDSDILLTRYSPAGGCGCKIPAHVLDEILNFTATSLKHPKLTCGYFSREDCAVYDLTNQLALLSTVDFFTPIVNDPYEFGQVAAANALSDVYAMGGRPILALSILAWPLDDIPVCFAKKVLQGASKKCEEVNIPMAGGHTIKCPTPLFGMTVNGLVAKDNLKRNNTARPSDLIFLTKPIGSGILSTAEKKGAVTPKDRESFINVITRQNDLGAHFANLECVTAMTDITGFGLLGHLNEMCDQNRLSAKLFWDTIPLICDLKYYLRRDCETSGGLRNWKSSKHSVGPMTAIQQSVLCDPQTNGGLIIAVDKQGLSGFRELLSTLDLPFDVHEIGVFESREQRRPTIEVH